MRRLLLLLMLTSWVRGEDSITLPLEGYYHPGRYMPVHIVAQPPQGHPNAILVRGEEMVWAVASAKTGENIDAVVPVMPISVSGAMLRYGWLTQPMRELPQALRPLNEHQRLIGFVNGVVNATDAEKIAAKIYPDSEFIRESLNPAQPLPGSAAGWEALDLIALDGAAASRIDELRFSALVAAGVAFAVHADQPPWPHWPWKQSAGGWWVIHHVPAGLADAMPNEQVYAPVSAFSPGWAGAMRWRYVLDAVGISLLLLLLALLRPKYTAGFAIVIAIVSSGLLIYYHQWERPLRTAEGKVRVVGSTITQDDDWAYYTSADHVFSRNRWVDTMHIVVPSGGLLSQMNARVECLSNGDAESLAFDVLAHGKVAVFCRRCGPQPPAITPSGGSLSPLEQLAKTVYLKPGDKILGELPSAPLISEGYFRLEQWPAVIVKQGH